MAVEKPNFNIETATPQELLLNNIETQRLETISLSNVNSESSIIDNSHAHDLAVSMKQKRGQLTPILVRARINEASSEITYDIMDGFHRTEGKRKAGDAHINATVVYGCSDEEMFDLRILAASSVRSVQFPRIINWITNSFNETVWAKKGLTVAQAFGMAVADSSRSNFVKLTTEETALLKEWVQEKCARWGRQVNSVYYILRISEAADPNLIKEVREATGGYSREITVTQSKLALVATVFPGEGYWPLQRTLLRYAVANKLKMSQIENIVEQLRGKIRPNLDEARYETIVRHIDLLKSPKVEKINDNKQPKQSSYEDSNYSMDDEGPTIEELESIEFGENSHSLGSGLETPKKSDPEPYERNHHGSGLATSFTRVGNQDNIMLYDRIQQLEDIVKNLKKEDEGQVINPCWWQTVTYLTPMEQKCLVSTFEEFSTLSVTAKRYRLTEYQVIGYIKSAFAKRSFSEGKMRSGVASLLFRRDQEEI